MCNLYSMTRNREAILRLFRVAHNRAGFYEPQPAIFPGYQASSSFGDGAVARYLPSLPELLLGVGGLGAAFLLTLVGVRALDFLPSDDSANAV